MDQLDLSMLHNGIPSLTRDWSGVFEAASIYCLDDQGHRPGSIITVDGSFDREFELTWSAQVDDEIRRCYGDPEQTTEWGACGIAILLITRLTNYTAIERSRKGTGFDYWLGSKEDASQNIFAEKARLEVSGIRHGTAAEVNKRAKIKHKQTNSSDSTQLPAYIAVVEFSKPCSRIAKK